MARTYVSKDELQREFVKVIDSMTGAYNRWDFGPTWHTINDDMAHIDANTLKAVGQTLVQIIFSEKP